MHNLIPRFIAGNFARGIFSGNFQAGSLFVDISGFTGLTEKLSSYGQEGAEILSRLINEVFTPCIDSVYKRKGFITGFAGDSFTALFPWDDLSTLYTAREIKKHFIEKPKWDTRFGSYEIKASIGMSYGLCEWGIVGSGDKMSYYFKGDCIDGCSLSEKHSGFMDIILDEKLYCRLKDIIKTEKVEGKFSKLIEISAGEKPKRATAYKSIKTDILKFFVPVQLLENRPLDELRDVVSIFVSFRNIEDSHESLNEFSKNLLKTVSLWGGYFSRIGFGDKGGTVLINLGIPFGWEDNIFRAVNCIYELNSLYGSSIRAGVTFGRLFAGIIGNSLRSAYDVLGDSVNQSARIAMKAEWGKVWVSAKIADDIMKAFDFDYIDEFRFKGKTRAVKVYQLKGKKKAADPAYQGKLYGREREVKTIRQAIAPVFKDRFAGLVYIHGDAGIGKTRLLYEALKNIEKKAIVCSLYCDRVMKKAWNPVIYFLNRYFRQDSRESIQDREYKFCIVMDELLSRLEDLQTPYSGLALKELKRTRPFLMGMMSLRTEGTIYDQLDAKQRYENSIFAVKEFFKGLSLIKPVIIKLEDIQWIDENSVELIQNLCRHIQDYPIAVICTSRLSDTGEKPALGISEDIRCNFIDLDFIADDPAKEKIRELTGKYPSKGLFELIKDRTLLNPFFMEELCSYLKENSFIQISGGQYQLSKDLSLIPDSISQILVARIDRLSAELREIIKIASVFGRDINKEIIIRLISAISEMAKAFKGIDRMIFDETAISRMLARDKSYYFSDGEKRNIWYSLDKIIYTFRHSLINETAYNMQLAERLRILHKYAGFVIENMLGSGDNLKKEYYTELAYHFEKGEDADRASYYLEKSGDYLKSVYRNAKAVDAYGKLLKYIRDNTKAVEIKLKIGEILELMGERKSLENLYRECIELSEKSKDSRLLSESLNAYGTLMQHKNLYDSALRFLEKSKTVSEGIGYKKGIATALGNIGNVYFDMGSYDMAEQYFEKCGKVMQAVGDEKGAGLSLANIGVIYMNRYQHDKAIQYLHKYKDICERLGYKQGIGFASANIGKVYLNLNLYDKAIEFFETDLEISKETGNKKQFADSTNNMGIAFNYLGDYDKALECFILAKAYSEEIGDKRGIASSSANIGNVYNTKGKYDKALKFMETDKRISEETGDERGVIRAIGNIGNVYQNLSLFSRALECFRLQREMSVKMGEPGGSALALGNMGYIYFNTGRFRKALSNFSESADIFYKLGDSLFSGMLYAKAGECCYFYENRKKALYYIERAISALKNIKIENGLLADCLIIKSKILFKKGLIEESERLNQEASIIAEKENSRDVIMASAIQRFVINSAQKKAFMLKDLSSVLKAQKINNEKKGFIFYDLFSLLRKEKLRKKALNILKNLYDRERKYVYRTMIKRLEKT